MDNGPLTACPNPPEVGRTSNPGQGCWFNYEPGRHLYFSYFIYPPYGVKAYDGTTRRVHGFSSSYDLERWTGSSPEDIKIALPLSAGEIQTGYRKGTVRGKRVSTVEVVMIPDKQDDEQVPERTRSRRDLVPSSARPASQAHFNGLAVLPYEGVYIGFPALHAIYAKGPAGVGDIGTMQIEMAFSRDLRHWRRDDRSVVVANGPAGSFDAGACCVSNRPLVVGDEIWLYYGGKGWAKGHPLPLIDERIRTFQQGKAGPPSGVGLSKWRLDGFVSLDGGNRGGTLITKSLIFSGRRLEINADARGGSIVVEMLGSDGAALPGFSSNECDPVSADSVRHVVSWKGRSDVTLLAGTEVRLRMRLTNAKLYAFQFLGEGPRA